MTLATNRTPDQRAWLDLLTEHGAGELLAVALGADGASLDTWRVHQVHARPGAEVTVGYDVVARRTLDPGATAACAGTSVGATEHLLATTAPLSPDAVGPGVVRLADGPRVLHVWRHPADPLLPGLAAACDTAALGRRLAAAGTLLPGETVDAVETVAYRPLRRAVLRVRTSNRTLYVKVVRPDRVRSLVRRHELFRPASPPGAGRVLGRVRAPACLAWHDDGVVVLEEARGTSLAQHLADVGPQAQPTAIDPRELVRALDTLPSRATTLTRRPGWAERVQHYAASALAVHGLDPERVERVARDVHEATTTRDPGPVVTTHGDFHEANVLLDVAPGRVRVGVLLDVDTLGPGHRVDDLACLVGHLAVLPSLAPAVYGGAGRLVDRCLRVFDESVDPVGLRARAAGVVLSLASGAASSDLAHAWLQVAERLLAAARAQASAVDRAPVRALSSTPPRRLTRGRETQVMRAAEGPCAPPDEGEGS